MPALSGQTTVANAGTALALGDQVINAAVTVKALKANTGVIYIGNDGSGDVADDSGFQLEAGEQITFDFAGNLSSILIDAEVNGEGVTWIILNA